MAKRSKNRMINTVRDASVISSPRLSLDNLLDPVRLAPLVPIGPPPGRNQLQNDLREFSPIVRPLDRAAKPVRITTDAPRSNLVGRFEFVRDDHKVDICVRRKQRREVMFAKGRGGGGKRRPRFNDFSKVKC